MKLLTDTEVTFVAGGWNNYDNPLAPLDPWAPQPRPGEERDPSEQYGQINP